MEPTLEVRHLRHRYVRDWAVDDVSFELTGTGISGLLGANGAGKSTTMNAICGVLQPTSGEIDVCGVRMHRESRAAKQEIGYLPQQAPLHFELTVEEYLMHAAKFRLVPARDLQRAVSRALDQCGISHVKSRLIGNLSGGYRQRVGIAQAIVHRPSVVVLDEPTNGLDPNQIQAVRELIRAIAEYQIVLLSTHILQEVAALCRNVIMLDAGKVVFDGTLTEFRGRGATAYVLIRWHRPLSESTMTALRCRYSASDIGDDGCAVGVDWQGDLEQLAHDVYEFSARHDLVIVEFRMLDKPLDEVFAIFSDVAESTA